MDEISLKEEQEYLDKTLLVVDNTIGKTNRRIEELDHELRFGKFGAESENQFTRDDILEMKIETKQSLATMHKALKVPYFGKIIYKGQSQPKVETFYIGRRGFFDKSKDVAVLDWRTPFGSLYYDSAVGPVSYTVKIAQETFSHFGEIRTKQQIILLKEMGMTHQGGSHVNCYGGYRLLGEGNAKPVFVRGVKAKRV